MSDLRCNEVTYVRWIYLMQIRLRDIFWDFIKSRISVFDCGDKARYSRASSKLEKPKYLNVNQITVPKLNRLPSRVFYASAVDC